MNMKKIAPLILLAAFSAAAATDIQPKPIDPGNLGAATNRFPALYARSVDATNLSGALSGTNLVAGTVSSNALDAATLALIWTGPSITNAATGAATAATNALAAVAFSGVANFATTNTPSALTNIVTSMAGGTATNLPAGTVLPALDAGAVTNVPWAGLSAEARDLIITNKQRKVAIGYNTVASGTDSFAEGFSTIASGNQSHAEGSATVASGIYSHAEGYNTRAGDRSHAAGSGALATNSNTFVWSSSVADPDWHGYSDSNGTFTVSALATRLFGGPIYGNGGGLTDLAGTNITSRIRSTNYVVDPRYQDIKRVKFDFTSDPNSTDIYSAITNKPGLNLCAASASSYASFATNSCITNFGQGGCLYSTISNTPFIYLCWSATNISPTATIRGITARFVQTTNYQNAVSSYQYYCRYPNIAMSPMTLFNRADHLIYIANTTNLFHFSIRSYNFALQVMTNYNGGIGVFTNEFNLGHQWRSAATGLTNSADGESIAVLENDYFTSGAVWEASVDTLTTNRFTVATTGNITRFMDLTESDRWCHAQDGWVEAATLTSNMIGIQSCIQSIEFIVYDPQQ
jgi:hypothetical protein